MYSKYNNMKTFTVFDSNLDIELEVQCGENAQENWNLIDDSRQCDIWFHLENKPSPHVVLKTQNKKKIHKQTLLYCAMLCKQHSKLSEHKNTSIIYTEIKNISKGKEVGSVITKNINRLKL